MIRWFITHIRLSRSIGLLALCPLCFPSSAQVGTALTPPLAWTYQTGEQGSDLGTAVSGAGDVNGDGFADVIVGAPRASGAEDRAGAAYVFYGPVTSPNPYPDVTLAGPIKGALFGSALASAGDINADGFDDVIVGAPGYNLPDSQYPDAGAAFIHHGTPSGLSVAPSLAIVGQGDSFGLGTAVAGAGDIDGDGYDDVVVGSPLYTNGESREGRIQVLFGSPTGLVTTTAQSIEGGYGGALFGSAVGGGGDVNDDGFADVIVGAPYYDVEGVERGAAFLFLGSATGLVIPPVWAGFGSTTGEDANLSETFGSAVAILDDTGSDGFDEWLVGAPGYDSGAHVDAGAVYVYYGHAGDLSTATPAWSKVGDMTATRLGTSAAAAGDVNSDDHGDIIVGAPFYYSSPEGSAKNEPEAAFIYLGSPTGLQGIHAWKLTTNQSTVDFGIAVGAAGDTDQDGFDDLLVGAPRYKRDTRVCGQAFSYTGVPGNGVGYQTFLPLVLRQLW